MSKKKNEWKGLVCECLVVVIIIVIILWWGSIDYTHKNNNHKVIANCELIHQELDKYAAKHGYYPLDINANFLKLADKVRKNPFTKKLTEPRNGMVIYPGEIGYNPRINPDGTVDNYRLTGIGYNGKEIINLVGKD